MYVQNIPEVWKALLQIKLPVNARSGVKCCHHWGRRKTNQTNYSYLEYSHFSK